MAGSEESPVARTKSEEPLTGLDATTLEEGPLAPSVPTRLRRVRRFPNARRSRAGDLVSGEHAGRTETPHAKTANRGAARPSCRTEARRVRTHSPGGDGEVT